MSDTRMIVVCPWRADSIIRRAVASGGRVGVRLARGSQSFLHGSQSFLHGSQSFLHGSQTFLHGSRPSKPDSFFGAPPARRTPKCQNLIVFCWTPWGCKSECPKPDCFYQKQRVFLAFDCFFARAVFGRSRNVKSRLFLFGGRGKSNVKIR